MRITILNQFYTPDISPTAHLAASLANHRAAGGDTVTVVASRGGYVPASADERNQDLGNPRVHRVWTPRLGKATILKRCMDYGVFYALAFWRLMTLPAQDVIVTLTTPPYIAWAAVVHKWLHGGAPRVILWNMDCYPDAAERLGVMRKGSPMSSAMRWLNRRLFRQVDELVCLDTAMVDLLLSQYGPREDEKALPTTIIPNWEPAKMFPSPFGRASAPVWGKAGSLGLDGKFVVLYLGNTGYGHEFDTALDAASMLRDEPVRFLFVGGGRRWADIERGVKQRGLTNVVMHGYVPKDETPSVMACAGCAMITLRDEALGIMSPSKLHSNLAAALPIAYVGPTTSNVDDAIVRFGCGVSLREGEPAALAAYLRRLAHEENFRNEQRRAARRAFDEAYCDSVTLRAFDAVIDGSNGADTHGSHRASDVACGEPGERFACSH